MFRRLLSSLARTQKAPARRRAWRPALSVESLEERELMASHLTATLQSGQLRVEGTRGNDTIHVRQDAGSISVGGISIITPAGPVRRVEAGSVSSIEVYGLAGNDVIRLDRGAQALTTPTLLDGGAGNDTLAGGAG